MRLLDLFCGAGGCSMGYHRAGFEVVGVDINPQPHYPFEFHQADALAYPLDGFDVIHASPPCQAFTPLSKGLGHPNLIPATRKKLLGKIYVIENVPGAPLQNPVRLCGSSFGLDVRRHRLFESSMELTGSQCRHELQTPRFFQNDYSRKDRLSSVVACYGASRFKGDFDLRKKAMDIDWMDIKELSQAIPPAYTEWIGRQIMEALTLKQEVLP